MEDKIKANEGKIKESEISREFERLLEEYSTEFVLEAKRDFEKAFNVESLLVVAGEEDDRRIVRAGSFRKINQRSPDTITGGFFVEKLGDLDRKIAAG